MAKHKLQLVAVGIFSADWWKATGWRILYTVLALFLPYALAFAGGEVSVTYVLSLAGFAAILALVTAMARLPETAGTQVPIWQAILWRLTRQAGQTLLAALAAYTMVEQVPWAETLRNLVGVLAVTLLRTLLDSLPETAKPLDDGASGSSRGTGDGDGDRPA